MYLRGADEERERARWRERITTFLSFARRRILAAYAIKRIIRFPEHLKVFFARFEGDWVYSWLEETQMAMSIQRSPSRILSDRTTAE